MLGQLTEIRCDSHLHGVLRDGVLEIKCRFKPCGAQPGVVILHQFDPLTGELIRTLKFKEPRIRERRDAVLRT
jgi:hypothetical protein